MDGREARKLWPICLHAFIFMVASLVAQQGHAVDLQPRSYTSQSGEFVLSVNPGDRSGAGKGTYTLTRGTKPQWSIELPFTFWEAAISNDGTFGGYAYSAGYDRDAGDFIVAIMDAKGAIRFQEKAPRTGSRYLHTAGDPKALGLILNNEQNRLVVRVADTDANAAAESWWTYDLDDGHLVGKPKPKELMEDPAHARFVISARAIAKTPLTLVQWLTTNTCCEFGADDIGTRFTLIDASDRPVWTLDLPNDYTRLSEDPQDRLLPRLREEGTILSADHAGSFELWHVADGTRVSYAVTEDATQPTGWRVRALESHPYAKPSQASAARAPAPAGELKRLGSITLDSGTSAESTPVRDIYDFTVADGGRLAFLTGCACADARDTALVVVDRSGRQLHKVPLPVLQGDGASYESVWIGSDRWVVTRSTHGVHTRSKAFVIDAAAGTATAVEGFDAAEIKSLASTTDGGFVALMTDWSKNTATDALSAFDASGTRRWTVGNDYSDKTQLFSPASVAVTTSHEVAVLENIRNALQVYDLTGKHVRTIDLTQAWRREPNYPSGIAADASGGVIIHDFHGHPPVVQMRLDGQVVRQFDPAFKDGRVFDIHGHVQVADDGTFWTSDGSAILQLDDKGMVTHVVGEKPRLDVLGEVAAMTVSSKGSIYAADERTGAVHVFDVDGKQQHVCRPDVSDYKGRLSLPSLTVSDQGDVFISRRESDEHSKPDFLHYDPEGRRSGVEFSTFEGVTQSWYSQPGSNNRWILGYESAYLSASDGRLIRRIDRQANGQWLEQPGPAATGPDGSIAIVSGARAWPPGSAGDVLVTLYSAVGEPRETWTAPVGFVAMKGTIAYDGEHVAFLTANDFDMRHVTLVLEDVRSHRRDSFSLPSANGGASVFLVRRAASNEVWLFDGSRTVHRFEMPPAT